MAIKANIIIDQGSSFSTSINLTDTSEDAIDLTGFQGAAQMRKHYTSTTYTPFVVQIVPSTGSIKLSLSSTTTATLVAGRYVYDVELTSSDGVISRIVEGIVTVTPNVTR